MEVFIDQIVLIRLEQLESYGKVCANTDFNKCSDAI